MQAQEFDAGKEGELILDKVDQYASTRNTETRDALINEVCNLSKSQLDATAKKLSEHGVQAERDGKGNIISFNFIWADSDMFFQVNTCKDRRLPNGDTQEEFGGTRTTRSFNGEHITYESTKEGPFKGFTANYDVVRDGEGQFKDCKVTSKYPDGVTKVAEVSEEDFQFLRIMKKSTLEFLTLESDSHNFYLQGRYE